MHFLNLYWAIFGFVCNSYAEAWVVLQLRCSCGKKYKEPTRIQMKTLQNRMRTVGMLSHTMNPVRRNHHQEEIFFVWQRIYAAGKEVIVRTEFRCPPCRDYIPPIQTTRFGCLQVTRCIANQYNNLMTSSIYNTEYGFRTEQTNSYIDSDFLVVTFGIRNYV